MSLPIVPNTTCDIYRVANAPPAAPDIAGVSIALKPDWRGANAKGFFQINALMWTHVAYMAPNVDIRDRYTGQMTTAAQDFVWIPDQTGTRFTVQFVQVIGLGTPGAHKQVFLDRNPAPPWPTNNL
jgi:hypothetical protein